MTNLAVIYYSSTGTLETMARRVAEAGEKAGAEVRLRHVEELAPEAAIASNPAWQAHWERVKDEPKATEEAENTEATQVEEAADEGAEAKAEDNAAEKKDES